MVAGGPGESAVQPRWLGEELIFVSDRTDWWNLYLLERRCDPGRCTRPTPSSAFPQWKLGQTPYAVLDDDQLLCTVNRSGEQSLAVLTRSRAVS